MTVDRSAIAAFLRALGVPDGGHVEWRCIHDTDKARAAIPFNETLDGAIESLNRYQDQGYGVFVVVQELDGSGRTLANVRALRAYLTDIDDDDAQWSRWQAMNAWDIPPSFFVLTSPGRFHAYWSIQPIARTDETYKRFDDTERRLVAKWGGDPNVIDPTRVMRVPGTWHLKNPASPVLVTMHPGTGATYQAGAVEWALAGVQAVSGGGTRRELGDVSQAAPSLALAVRALGNIDPNTLAYEDWLRVSASFKQSAWTHTTPDVVEMLWADWCKRYRANDVGANIKLWNSVRNSSTGWNYLSGASGMKAELMFSDPGKVKIPGQSAPAAVPGGVEPTMFTGSGILTPAEQVDWFKGCIFVEAEGRILTPSGRLMDQQRFNGAYGSRQFVITTEGKVTDEPWRAATRGQVFSIAKVDHLRFVPTVAPGAVITDDFGRAGINTYRPAVVEAVEGDASPWVAHIRAMVPTEHDQRILLSFFAHCVQRPGVKVLWAPLIQSAEGAGKGIIGEALTYAIGGPYVHKPNAQQLADSGSKFNGWLASKLLIIADEIRVDEKRDMLEALKPMITESRLEMEGKGVDQVMGDNIANWIMFTNYKDAIPITKDSRRYAIIYSPLQHVEDIVARGMGGDYFPKLYAWLRGDGKKHVAWFLKNYPIEAELDPMLLAHRAPVTSSTAEAIVASRGAIEQRLIEAIETNTPGFAGGWLSSSKAQALLHDDGIKAGPHTIKRAIEGLGYHFIGRANGPIAQEGFKQPNLYALDKNARPIDYLAAQGYV